MNRSILCLASVLSIALLTFAPAALRAQTAPTATDTLTPQAVPPGVLPNPAVSFNTNPKTPPTGLGPFSHVAFGGGISVMGINMQTAVNIDRFLNVRGVGNYFQYTRSNISVSGFNVAAKANFATAGVAADFFPWPNHGFRVSPGVLFYNQNAISGTMVANGGTSFTLNDVTYYSSPSAPVSGVAAVNLHSRTAAPTATIGWGNLIPRRGGHFSFPFELGAAMVGAPVPTIALTSGQVCSNAQGTAGCQNVVGNASLNTNLQAQIAKYKNDLQPLSFYPILSFGIGYSFPIR